MSALTRAFGSHWPTRFLALITLAACAAPWGLAHADWQRVHAKDGVTVYAQERAGSKIHTIKGVTTVRGSLGSLVAVLDDTAAFPAWHPDFVNARPLAQPTFRERYIYLVNDMPWPATDRDVCYRIQLSRDPRTGTVTLQLDAAPQRVEETEHVRVRESHGKIELEPVGDGRVRVSWTLFTDPRLSAPASMINDAVAKGRIKLLTNLRQQAGTEPYRHARLRYDTAGHLDGIEYEGSPSKHTHLTRPQEDRRDPS